MRHLHRAARGQAGFTLVEALIALVLFVAVAAAVAQLLGSAIVHHGIAKERTVAQQAAQDQLESIRELDYDDVGVVAGNPPGTIVASKSVTLSGVKLTVVTQVSYVADPTPTSYATYANYKKVTVTVRRQRDSHLLARQVTYVAPPSRAPYGGLNYAIVNVQVVDVGNATPIEDANVQLVSTNPSVNRNDTTDPTGTATFAALDANPSASYYHDITASKTGYVTLKDDLSPAAAAHVSLAPSQTFNTAIRLYKPATIYVLLKNLDGTTFTGDASVVISSSRGSETFAYSGGLLTVTSIAGEQVVPALQYTVAATVGATVLSPVTKYVPTDYPTDLTSQFTLTVTPHGDVKVTVTQDSAPAVGATVTLAGGPDSISVVGTADANGEVLFTGVPAGSGYTVSATRYTKTATADVTVTGGEQTSVSLSLDSGLGSLVATVTWAGSAVSGATVTLTGGPGSVSLTGTTNGSGQVTFGNLPAGSGYTVSATSSGQSASQPATVTAGSSTGVSLALPTGTVVVTVTWAGSAVSGATVTLTGGPRSLNLTGTSNGSGQVTFTTIPAGSGYTATATKSGQSASNPAVSVTGGSTTSVGLALPTGTITVNVKWSTYAISGATVTLTGGPQSLNLSASTDASGNATFTSVPAGGSYSVSATKSTWSASQSSISVTGGSTTNVNLTLSGGTTGTLTVNVKRSGVNQSGATVLIQGGPLGFAGATITATTDGSGNAVFTLPTGSGYTVKGYKCSVSNPKSGTNSSVTVNTGANTSNISFSTNTCPLT